MERILLLRGEKVMLDADLAPLYGVSTKRLNEQVRRNRDRFPQDFMFRLSRAEVSVLNRSRIATGSQKHRDPRFAPYAFTEHGAIMLASVLNSPIAVRASLQVVRAFVRLRRFALSYTELARKLEQLEAKSGRHDRRFRIVFQVLRRLMTSPEPRRKGKIGFRAPVSEA